MRELPRQLTVDELSELFEGRTRLVERLAEIEDPLEQADDVVAALDEAGEDRGPRGAPGDRAARRACPRARRPSRAPTAIRSCSRPRRT